MREIKFRAWDKCYKEMWSVGRLYFMPDGSVEMVLLDKEKSWPKKRLFEEIELMQYTGLKDKNGKEIYEGDIMKTTFRYKKEVSEYFDEVTFYNGKFSFGENKYSLHAHKNEIEVAGNIYENPELLVDNT